MGKNYLGDIEHTFAFLREKWTSDEKYLFLKYCGIERCLPGHGYGPTKRDCYLIHFILEGQGVYEYKGERIRLEKGQSFLIYPDEYVYYEADQTFPWKYCWIAFQGAGAARVVDELGYTHASPVCAVSDVKSVEESIAGIIAQKGEGTGNLLRRCERFFHLIANLLEQGNNQDLLARQDGADADLRLGSRAYTAQAVHYLETHFREKVRIRNLAQEIGISRSYLTQQFKETIGMSPREMLISIRMEHATKYLEKSSDPIQLVALECGYDDALAFSKAFKARFGMSPTKYRRQAQQSRSMEAE